MGCAAKALKGPARMPEGGTRRQGYIVRLAPVRSPCTSDVPSKKTRDEDRRLKEKGEHGIHPVVPPRFLIARIWGDIMICTAENLPAKITNNAHKSSRSGS
jgi:hypothetical protein